MEKFKMIYQVLIQFYEDNVTKEKQIQIESDVELHTEEDVYNLLGNWQWFEPDVINFWIEE